MVSQPTEQKQWEVHSLAEALEYLETPEGIARSQSEEMHFRKGYRHAVLKTIELLEAGYTRNQLIDWYNGPIWSWYHRDRSTLHEHRSEESPQPNEPPRGRRKKS